MQGNQNTVRSHWVHLRLRAEEHQKLMGKFKRSTCRKISEFVRNCIFEKPITMLHRNASIDEGLQDLCTLREELRAIGNNLNQITHKVNANPALAGDKFWQAEFLSARSAITLKIDTLNASVTKLSGLWLQS